MKYPLEYYFSHPFSPMERLIRSIVKRNGSIRTRAKIKGTGLYCHFQYDATYMCAYITASKNLSVIIWDYCCGWDKSISQNKRKAIVQTLTSYIEKKEKKERKKKDKLISSALNKINKKRVK